MMRNARAREAGFTLLELLISITILAMIMVAITGGVRFAGQAWDAERRLSEGDGDADAVHRVLRQMIAGGRSFVGERGGFRLAGRLPEGLGRAGLYDIDVTAANNRLSLSWRARGKTQDRGSSGATELAAFSGSVTFAYYDGSGGWQASWANANEAPKLIRLTVAGDGDGMARSWIFAPQIEETPGKSG